ncbi:hypothetical protein AltI4_45280 (plasmid) [Alteromonas sp. I4]|nr:hypothetical protein AltI4_45280 [Alteromonas sp. I4]
MNERLSSVAGLTIGYIPNGPQYADGTSYVEATETVPAYCQVTGKYVTNPETGKTANFLATLPENWNGKYLQLGCSGQCGYLFMNNPAVGQIPISAQGYPGQLIEKGYAIFGNDLGHVLDSPASNDTTWMIAADGSMDVDAVEDYLYRADEVMADLGKSFTTELYGSLMDQSAEIDKAYYSGCSQGGRGALIAATRFPDKFDGIIAGSPAQDLPGLMMQGPALMSIAQNSTVTPISAEQAANLNAIISEKCDIADGIKDGLIQNPNACDFDPKEDLPICAEGEEPGSCVTEAQANLLSAFFSGVTNADGEVKIPGFAINNSNFGFIGPIPAGVPVDTHLRQILGDAFAEQSLFSSAEGGDGQVTNFHAELNEDAYQAYKAIMREGTIEVEDFDSLIAQGKKLIWYHNLADETLTPNMSINRYKKLAEMNGGYDQLKNTIRLFTVPNTGHCGLGGDGPGNFDAIGALESWVEESEAPDQIIASQLDPAYNNILWGIVDYSVPPLRTMPLCTFPQMASYIGSGVINSASNWECNATDERMLEMGSAGVQAGVYSSNP